MQFDDALLGTELDARASWEIQSGSILKLKNANCVVHTDLHVDGPKVYKKSLLCQNGLYINRKCLRLIVRYFPSPFLSAF